MSIEQANEDRRRHFRWRASGPDGWIAPNHKISLRDISYRYKPCESPY